MKRSLVVPILLLLSFSALAQRHRASKPPLPAGSPEISEEYAAGDLAYGPEFTGIASPRIATGPDQSLIVWSGSGATKAARIDSSGHPLDVTPISLAGKGQPGYPADVVWDGIHYVVAATSYSDTGWVVRLVGISPSGRLDSNYELVRFTHQPLALSMTRHATGEYAIAYETNTPEGQHEVGVIIAAANGQILKELSFGLQPAVQTVIRIASSPSGYLALWDGGGAAIGLHGTTSRMIAMPHGEYDLAWNGSDYFAVRADYAWDGTTATWTIHGSHVTQAGEVSPSTVIHTAAYSAHFPAVVWRNGDYIVSWKQQIGPASNNGQWYTFDLDAARVAADGSVLEERQLAAQTDTYNKWGGRVDSVAVATQGNRTVFVWSAQQGGTVLSGSDAARDLYALAMSTAALPGPSEVGAASRVTSKAAYESVLAVTAAPGSARLFWAEPTYSWLDAQNSTATVDLAGRTSPTTALPVPVSPYFARSGDGTVMVARETTAPYRVMMAFVDASGNSTAPVAIVAPNDGLTASVLGVACGASECVVVYSLIKGNSVDPVKYLLQRVTPSGALIDAPVDVPPGFAAINALGNEYLLLFHWPMQDHNVVVSRFADGKLSDITTLVPQSTSYNGAVASNGKEWLVLWSGMRDSRGTMTAFRIDAAGNVITQTDITLQAGGFLTRFAATWDGKDWIVAWNQSGPQLLNDIRAARIAPEGTLIDKGTDGDGFGVAATIDDEYAFSIDSAGNGLSAVAYSRATTEQKYGQTSRVFVRWIDNR